MKLKKQWFINALFSVSMSFFVLFSVLLPSTADAGSFKQYNSNKQGILIDGYDVVSYFGTGPILGKSEFQAQHQGATLHFATAENRDLFLKDPSKYFPAYGGWCATAVAKDDQIEINPSNFVITNGRLFLFYKESGLFGGDAKPIWVKDEAKLTQKADEVWKKWLSKKAQ